ncbi:MAG: hypothetical protein KBE09_01930 [Candidatus Pacebacteria bacterium]|nr:hypothetical protein [Candidatus Paceibacterota bacterium]
MSTDQGENRTSNIKVFKLCLALQACIWVGIFLAGSFGFVHAQKVLYFATIWTTVLMVGVGIHILERT